MFSILPITGLPEIMLGDDLAALIADRLTDVMPNDIIVVTQKIVSKAEGRFVDLSSIEPSDEAKALALEVNKDAALVELVLREATAIIRKAPNVLITRHRLGHVMANSGIDASNIGADNGGSVLLLPQDPDASAAQIVDAIYRRTGIRPAVIISDSFGRPWRMGTVNIAIGISGMPAIFDQRGQADRDGRVMQVTQIAVADAVAGAAGLAMGEGAEGIPVVIVRGLVLTGPAQTSAAALRPVHEDLFQ
jgi:coenzyme F420-0:L-glutamate ligase / coenzyme F420-1:gamma-L-glutamate ligase